MGRQPPPDIVSAAQAAARAWPPTPASVILAQWALESGWGEHLPPGSNDPFGEKALPSQASVASPTVEVVAGHLTPTNAPFRAFASLADAFEAHAEHLATSHWFIAARGCLPHDLEGFCDALGHGSPQRPSYSTDPDYGPKLMAIIAGSDLTAFDGSCA